ncbi:cytochrome P450 [Kibdelosporangium aridum]|uniref:Cytochrome P450 n=1 Tax=Kibdelosporangium aridum TaxID=2030 RepID=A0A1Y5YCJ8_KIBAR|nr:cytochrome P450 [Kibdelosporangium aridum]SMD27590.1 Cytochrome P450 [Kibdelosporangium aridum]
MNRNEFRWLTRTIPFLDAHIDDPAGVLELRARPARRLLVWHPVAIDWIFRSDQRFRHAASRTLRPLLGEQSLLWAEGARHAAYRQMLGPPLRGSRLTAIHGIVSDTVHGAIDALVPPTVVSLADWTRTVTLRIISRLVLGQVDDRLLASFTNWIHRALGSPWRTLAYRYLWRGVPRSSEELDHKLVRCAKATANQPATLAGLLLAHDGLLPGLDDSELRDQIVSLLFAGHETTAAATAWTLYWLDRNDTVRRDVVSELDATSADGSDATQIPLLHAVVQEALRLSPPAMLAGNRVLTTDSELLGLPLAAGTILTPCIYLTHRWPAAFPQPHRFDPGRFLNTRVPPRHYWPFGGGTRHCLGSQLALTEIRMIAAAVLRRCEIHCVNADAGVAQLRGHVLAPAQRLGMAVTVRRP